MRILARKPNGKIVGRIRPDEEGRGPEMGSPKRAKGRWKGTKREADREKLRLMADSDVMKSLA